MNLDALCVNTIRTLSIDAVQGANSGHPGLPLGAAPMAYVLWQNHLKHHPRDPSWPDRDRFVLSPGHGSMLLYSLLHLTGYDLSLDELKNFRRWGSKTPGHPEYKHTAGVESTTGPLGQGASNVVGMAIAERALAHRFNRPGHTIVDHFTYGLVSDGDLMEGISGEAASLAGHLKLGKLICLYDSNDVTLDGPTNLAYSEEVSARYQSYGWHVQAVRDGDKDLAAIDQAISKAKAETTKPSLIIVKTTIGYGSPNKQGKSSSHGSPLGDDEVALTKKALGWDPQKKFYIPEDALKNFHQAIERGAQVQKDWQKRFDAYAKAFPEMAIEWAQSMSGEIPADALNNLPSFDATTALPTREASGKVIQVLAARIPSLIGGDADLSCSTNTLIKDSKDFDGQTGVGRNIRYGVREHAMGAIANGIEYHGGLRSFVATFFCFSDYMRPAVRLAAMNQLPAIYVWTHDSIALGEDGPTHQPVEHLMSLRAMPGLRVIRPCDANETVEAWRSALLRINGPTALILSRQKLATLDRQKFAPASGLAKGAYVLADAPSGKPSVILIATGSEVHPTLQARDLLMAKGIEARVVSMPCWDLFMDQPESYRDSVIPPQVRARVSVEAGVTFGWEKWIGLQGAAIGLDRFGASAPEPVLMEKFGFSPAAIAERAQVVLRLSKA